MQVNWKEVYKTQPAIPRQRIHYNEIEQWNWRNHRKYSPKEYIDLQSLQHPDNTHLLSQGTTNEEITDIVKKLKIKATGSSGIGTEVLKKLPPNIINIFKQLYNASIATGYFPKFFKSARCIMIPKPGKNHELPLSYRPISLLEHTGKIFEKIINTRLRLHLEENSLLSNQQFGFRPHKSTSDPINIISEFIDAHSSRGRKIGIISKDVEKAFDTVWHNGLKFKFQHFQLPDITQTLLTSFLTNRNIKINFRDKHSSGFTPAAGVPQGSTLSPTLYNMYVNDMPRYNNDFELTLQYADDVTILTASRSKPGIIRVLQRMVNSINIFEEKWRIKTNPTKCQLLTTKTTNNDQIKIYSSDLPTAVPIPRYNEIKILGVTFDSRAAYHKQTDKMTNLAKQTINLLKRFYPADTKTKLHLYKALVRPILDYAPGPSLISAATNQLKAQRIQNRALKWALDHHWSEFTTAHSWHVEADMLPLNIRRASLLQNQLEKLEDNETHQRLRRLHRNNHNNGCHHCIFQLQEGPPLDPIFT